MQEQQARRIVREFATYAIPDDIDLWPAIRRQIAATDGVQREHMPKSPGLYRWVSTISAHPRLRFATIVVILLVVFGALVNTPVTRAALDAIVRRFGLSFVDTSQMHNATSVQADATTIAVPPSLTLADAQRQVPFSILTPHWLPEGLTLGRIIVSRDIVQMPEQTSAEQIVVSLLYRIPSEPVKDDAPVMLLDIIAGPPGNGYLLAASREQHLTIHGQPAVYVHGSWRSDGQGDPNTTLGNLRWDDTLDSSWLSWEVNGLTYRLAIHNLGLSREEVLQIAESIR